MGINRRNRIASAWICARHNGCCWCRLRGYCGRCGRLCSGCQGRVGSGRRCRCRRLPRKFVGKLGATLDTDYFSRGEPRKDMGLTRGESGQGIVRAGIRLTGIDCGSTTGDGNAQAGGGVGGKIDPCGCGVAKATVRSAKSFGPNQCLVSECCTPRAGAAATTPGYQL